MDELGRVDSSVMGLRERVCGVGGRGGGSSLFCRREKKILKTEVMGEEDAIGTKGVLNLYVPVV